VGVRAADPKVLRVVLADDAFLVREGIAAVIAGFDDIELAASCGDLDAVRGEIERTAPDVVLTDIRMPPAFTDEGIRLATELRSTHPDVGVLVLSQYAEPFYAVALFAEGTSRRGYLLKDRVKDPDELGRAIREVGSGGALVDPRIVDGLIAGPRVAERTAVDALTAREREVLALVAAAHTNAAIASRLGISTRGVERHINAIFDKLSLGDAGEVNPRVKASLIFLASQGRLADERPSP
jgi:DNA-binding NarL/FixJ family response regulator